MEVTVLSDLDAATSAPTGGVEAPRKSRRLSPGLALTRGASVNTGSGRISRFGFKSKKTAVVTVDAPAPSAGGAATSAAPELEPLDMSSVLLESLGDLDAYDEILKPQKMGKELNDFRWYQSKHQEMKETIKNLKESLRQQVARGKRASESLEPLQEQINSRLKSLGQEAHTHQAAAESASAAFATERQKAEERAKTIVELKAAAEALKLEMDELTKRVAAESERADTAEASLSERDADLASAVKVGEELQAEGSAQQAAADDAAATAKAEIERLTSEGAATAATLATTHADAAAAQAELTASRDAETARAADLEAKLGAVTTEGAALKDAKSTIEKEHKEVSEAAAATRARLESVEAQLAEKTATLGQKDEDLRESLRNNMQMQKDNAAVVEHERARSQQLEDEARQLRTGQQEAIAASTQATAEKVKAKEELEAISAELASSQAALLHANGERERLAIETAERHEEILKQQQAAAALTSQLAEASQQLSTKSAELVAKSTEAERLSSSLHSVEVEFKSYKEHHGTSNAQQMAAISDLKLTVDRLEAGLETKTTEVQSSQGTVAMQEAYLATLESKLREQERMRRELHNTIQELKGNIRVFCRVRPAAEGAPRALELHAAENSLKLSHSSGSSSGKPAEPHEFGFDKVFPPATNQETVFAEVDGLVQSSLDGYKVCIFAYGQTGSGKTHTMQGGADPASWGLIPRALSKILTLSEGMKADGWSWSLSASFLEIYNEQLKDLLHDAKAGAPPSYAIKHDEAWGTVVANMGRHEVSSMEQINKLMARAAKARSVGSTDMNAQSSRSHSVFALYLQGTNAKLNLELNGALHLVDLAGSERVGKSGAEGAALKEAQNINKSLSALSGVFNAKASGASHVPFRDSKLTFLMEPCLSGQGKTLMFVNIAPEVDHSHETLCSLKFAKTVSQTDTGGGQKGGTKRNAKEAAPSAAASAKVRPATGAPAGAPPAKRK